jgi:tRNA G26 N,N-dimethylase Trm1
MLFGSPDEWDDAWARCSGRSCSLDQPAIDEFPVTGNIYDGNCERRYSGIAGCPGYGTERN